MPRNKKSATQIMNDAAARLAGIKSIAADIDLGNGLKAETFGAKIAEVGTALEDYNTTLSTADEKLNIFNAREKELKDMHERMLIAVAAKYGKDSDEYEKAGGKRKSERKRPTRKQAPTA
jgi:hypothetical protein